MSLFSAPVISITEAGRDSAENGRELHSDSKVCPCVCECGCVCDVFLSCLDTCVCGRKKKKKSRINVQKQVSVSLLLFYRLVVLQELFVSMRETMCLW